MSVKDTVITVLNFVSVKDTVITVLDFVSVKDTVIIVFFVVFVGEENASPLDEYLLM